MHSPIRIKRALGESLPGPAKRRSLESEDAQDSFLPDDVTEKRLQAVGFVSESEFDMVDCSMFRGECSLTPPGDSIEKSCAIDCRAREALVNCLVQLHDHFELSWATLFLSVNLLDRYLGRVPVDRCDMQLVGVTSMLVAAKFLDLKSPGICELVDCTHNNCTAEDISAMECSFLQALDFRLACTTADIFLDRLQQLSGIEEIQHGLACYLVELTLLDVQFFSFPPSHIASAALLLSNSVFQRHPAWPDEVASMARYSESALQSCVSAMLVCATAAQPKPSAVRRKYMSTEHYSSWSTKLKAFQQAQHIIASPGRPHPVVPPVLKALPSSDQCSAGRDHSGLSLLNKSCQSRPKCRISSESLCELQCERRGCRRAAIHMQAFEGICRKSVGSLKDMCKARRLPCSGAKDELALRLIDAMFH